MKKHFIVFLFFYLFLAGCASKESTPVEKGNNEYKESSIIFQQDGLAYQRQDIGLGEKYAFYFLINDDENESEINFYSQEFLSEKEPNEILIISYETIIFASDVYSKDGKDFFSILFWDDKKNLVRKDFDFEGNEVLSVSPIAEFEDYYSIADMAVLSDSRFFVVTDKMIYHFDNEGNCEDSFSCPGEYFIRTVHDSSRIAVSYKKANGVFVQSLTLDGEFENDAKKVTGDGNLLTYNGSNELVYADGSGIYLAGAENQPVVSFQGRNIKPDLIRTIKSDGEKFFLWGNTSDGNSAKLTILERKESEEENLDDSNRYDRFGRKIVYLYCICSMERDNRLGVIIDSFNEKESDFQIVVLNDSPGSQAFGGEISKLVIDGNTPDLIFSLYDSNLYKFGEEGLLEDLVPYIEASNNISMSDIDKNVCNGYTFNGKLIGLPAHIEFNTLWTIDSSGNERNFGWSYKDFFDWYTKEGTPAGPFTSKEYVFKKLMPPILDECIDINGNADFCNDSFKDYLKGIKELNISTEALGKKESMELTNRWLKESNMSWLGTSITGYDNLYSIGKIHGAEAQIVGYPSSDGEPVVYYDMPSLSILSVSEVKEEAYDFLEYYLTFVESEKSQLTQDYGYVYTLVKNRNASIDYVMDFVSDAVEKEYMEKSIGMTKILLEKAMQKDFRSEDITEMVWEEASAYFDSNKDLEETCKVIEGRVQTYLNEKK